MLPDKLLIPLYKYLREPDIPDASAIIHIFDEHGYYLHEQTEDRLSFIEKKWTFKQKLYLFIAWAGVSSLLLYVGSSLPYASQLAIWLLTLGAMTFGLLPMYWLLLFTTYEYQYDIYLTGNKAIKPIQLDSKLKAFFKRFTVFMWVFGGGLLASIFAYIFGSLLGFISRVIH